MTNINSLSEKEPCSLSNEVPSPHISIIIPCYKVERYLNDCLDSICTQGCNQCDYEVIAVNDGSPDRTGEILKLYSQRYSNLRIIEQKNGGVSAARNRGLEICRGRYIWFVDGDDFLIPGSLKFIIDNIRDAEPDIVHVNLLNVPDSEKYPDENENTIFSSDVQHIDSTTTACRVLDCIYKYEQLNGQKPIRFVEGMKYGEDAYFNYLVYRELPRRSNGALRIIAPVYCYRCNPNSAMRSKDESNACKHVVDLITLAYMYKKHLEQDDWMKWGENMKHNTKLRQYLATQGALSILPCCSLDVEKQIAELKKKKLYPYPFFICNFIIHWKNRKLKEFLTELIKQTWAFEPFYRLYYYSRYFCRTLRK